ncbi:MAG: BMP family ABC transporter substrate-binding protein [Aestuariibacter sp.]|nr:BMP family ABC transporter substrate-binding protein [Aestuariibacter sp.]
MRRILISILTLVLMIGLAGVLALAGDPPKLVGLAIPEAGTDKGWNEQGKVGLEAIAKKYGFKIELGEALGYGDIKPTLRDMVKKGCDLIVCHAAGYQTVAPEIARETGVKIITIENHKDITPGLISDIDTQPQGGSYIAGWLAGKMTRSNIVGIVTSAEPPTWNRMSAGFAQGLKTSNPNCKLLYSVIGEEAYADAAGAKRNTVDQIAVGADVIFGMGDGASFGMLQACSTKKAKDGGKTWFIDVIGDKRSIDKSDVLLTSVLWDMSVVYDEIIKSYMDGTYGKDHWVAMDNGAIYLLEPNKAVPQDIRTELKAIEKKVKSGAIQVVDLPVAADLHNYLRKTFSK